MGCWGLGAKQQETQGDLLRMLLDTESSLEATGQRNRSCGAAPVLGSRILYAGSTTLAQLPNLQKKYRGYTPPKEREELEPRLRVQLAGTKVKTLLQRSSLTWEPDMYGNTRSEGSSTLSWDGHLECALLLSALQLDVYTKSLLVVNLAVDRWSNITLTSGFATCQHVAFDKVLP